jgi:hypothetical protein
VHCRLGPYEQHDLVALAENGVVGVVVECGPDSCRVLTNRGTPDRPEIRSARLPDIKRKLMMRNAVSNDQGLNPVRPWQCALPQVCFTCLQC